MNPQANNRSISFIRRFHLEGNLDLSPSFQRKPVWTDAQASYLIDSILNDLPIPEIYVRLMVDANGDETMEVVDGQQRLRSIIRFYSNDLVLSGKDVTEPWQGISWGDLTEAQVQDFWAYRLVVRELERASDLEVRDMFRRLNANQSNLNDQELRHSQYHGEFISLVEELASDRWWLEHKIVTPKQIHRMLDAEFVAELLASLMGGPLNKKVGLDDYFVDYDSDLEDRDEWKDLFEYVRDQTKVLADGDLKGWTSKTEYYSFFLAVAACAEEDELPTGRRLTSAKRRLAEFRQVVNRAKQRGSQEEFGEDIRDYVQAATRASTDLSRRITRIDIVKRVITG